MSSPRRPCDRDIRLHLLGPLTLVGPSPAAPLPDVPRGRAATLLGLLAARRNRIVSIPTIVDTLWPAGAPPSAVQSVAALISRLRRLVGQCLERVGAGYRLDTTGWRVDLDEATHLASTAERHLAGGEPALADVAARRALELLTAGQAAEGLPAAPWTEDLEGEADRLLRRARHAAWSSAARLGDHRQSAEVAAAALRADPYDESACRALISAHLALGSPGAALLTFDSLRRRLRTELGTDPDPRTAALHQAVLGNGALAPEDRVQTPPGGLRRAAAAAALVGRADEVERLHGAWRAAVAGRRTAVLVQGSGGMGKSALLAEMSRHAVQDGAALVQVQCAEPAYAPGATALTRAVARYCATARPQDVRQAAAGVERQLAVQIAELHALLGPVGAPAGAPSGATEPDPIAAFLRRTADHRPVLLAVDDAHLADPATLAALRRVHAAVSDHRFLFVVAAGETGAPEGLLPLVREADHLTVGPLPLRAVAELAARHVRAPIVPDLLRLTAGRPALVVEALAAAADGTALSDHLPDGLTRVARDLVQRLGEPVTGLLRQAAIVGPLFHFDEVVNISGLPGREVARRLERALRAEVLRADGETFSFAGEVLHTVLTDDVPEALRRALTGLQREPAVAHFGACRGRHPFVGTRPRLGAPRCGCRPR